eukprot:CAMPEP_0202968758 /NCGR_PEP_ID=MMETSP1396-20130829/14188_1 /ASSEMBLY_ACC=CAM_ASM_000872 /TAXON_ID= /ORGANISM="Pseudokeronopsis sp., Strain Brazil" /LENGTH=68 /DNA_ID=CAMNT_0049695437 /DNA_START=110 /DNA_END=316 /DNA_ORIENTATION=+
MLDYLDEEGANDAETGATANELEKVRTYKAAKGDDVDEAMANMINMHGFKLPVIRMHEGKYLIGTESK